MLTKLKLRDLSLSVMAEEDVVVFTGLSYRELYKPHISNLPIFDLTSRHWLSDFHWQVRGTHAIYLKVSLSIMDAVSKFTESDSLAATSFNKLWLILQKLIIASDEVLFVIDCYYMYHFRSDFVSYGLFVAHNSDARSTAVIAVYG